MHPYFLAHKPRLLAHRGSPSTHCENTLGGFLRAAEHTEYLEMDVWMSRSGSLWVHHDASLERLTGVKRALSECEDAELEQLSCRYNNLDESKLTKLSSVFEALPKSKFNIELKDSTPEAASKLIQTALHHNAFNRCLFAAEDPETLNRLRLTAPNAAFGASREDVARVLWCVAHDSFERWPRGPMHAVQVPEQEGNLTVVSEAFVKLCHKQNVEVHVWTVNNPNRARELIEMGCDGIVSDLPWLLSSLR